MSLNLSASDPGLNLVRAPTWWKSSLRVDGQSSTPPRMCRVRRPAAKTWKCIAIAQHHQISMREVCDRSKREESVTDHREKSVTDRIKGQMGIKSRIWFMKKPGVSFLSQLRIWFDVNQIRNLIWIKSRIQFLSRIRIGFNFDQIRNLISLNNQNSIQFWSNQELNFSQMLNFKSGIWLVWNFWLQIR